MRLGNVGGAYLVVVIAEGDLVLLVKVAEVSGQVAHPEFELPVRITDLGVLFLNLDQSNRRDCIRCKNLRHSHVYSGRMAASYWQESAHSIT